MSYREGADSAGGAVLRRWKRVYNVTVRRTSESSADCANDGDLDPFPDSDIWPAAPRIPEKPREKPLTTTQSNDPLLVELRKETARLVESDHGEAGNTIERRFLEERP